MVSFLISIPYLFFIIHAHHTSSFTFNNFNSIGQFEYASQSSSAGIVTTLHGMWFIWWEGTREFSPLKVTLLTAWPIHPVPALAVSVPSDRSASCAYFLVIFKGRVAVSGCTQEYWQNFYFARWCALPVCTVARYSKWSVLDKIVTYLSFN